MDREARSSPLGSGQWATIWGPCIHVCWLCFTCELQIVKTHSNYLERFGRSVVGFMTFGVYPTNWGPMSDRVISDFVLY